MEMTQTQEIESRGGGLYPVMEMARLQRLRDSLVPIKGPVEPVLQLFARSAAAWAILAHKMPSTRPGPVRYQPLLGAGLIRAAQLDQSCWVESLLSRH
jgi:hypothetical protein